MEQKAEQMQISQRYDDEGGVYKLIEAVGWKMQWRVQMWSAKVGLEVVNLPPYRLRVPFFEAMK